jgi:hypothetical protein
VWSQRRMPWLLRTLFASAKFLHFCHIMQPNFTMKFAIATVLLILYRTELHREYAFRGGCHLRILPMIDNFLLWYSRFLSYTVSKVLKLGFLSVCLTEPDSIIGPIMNRDFMHCRMYIVHIPKGEWRTWKGEYNSHLYLCMWVCEWPYCLLEEKS